MTTESLHIAVGIARPAAEVYDYASDPTNLPDWAAGLGSSITSEDGQWFVESPMGRVGVRFAPRNDYGVLDHEVTLPSGETFHNPMRVLPLDEGSEAVFTLRRQDGVSDEDFDRDAAAVRTDLETLKRIMEGEAGDSRSRG